MNVRCSPDSVPSSRIMLNLTGVFLQIAARARVGSASRTLMSLTSRIRSPLRRRPSAQVFANTRSLSRPAPAPSPKTGESATSESQAAFFALVPPETTRQLYVFCDVLHNSISFASLPPIGVALTRSCKELSFTAHPSTTPAISQPC